MKNNNEELVNFVSDTKLYLAKGFVELSVEAKVFLLQEAGRNKLGLLYWKGERPYNPHFFPDAESSDRVTREVESVCKLVDVSDEPEVEMDEEMDEEMHKEMKGCMFQFKILEKKILCTDKFSNVDGDFCGFIDQYMRLCKRRYVFDRFGLADNRGKTEVELAILRWKKDKYIDCF